MATTRRVTPALNGMDGYLRWKESMLLTLHTAGVAHVLFDDPPPPLVSGGGGSSALPTAEAVAVAKQWARDDGLCRGHILEAVSDRLLWDYARHATAANLWRALARTYDIEGSPGIAWRRFTDFQFDEAGSLPEQLAHAEALGAVGHHAALSDGVVAGLLCNKLPARLSHRVKMWSSQDSVTMDTIWGVVRSREAHIMMEGGNPEADISSPDQDPE